MKNLKKLIILLLACILSPLSIQATIMDNDIITFRVKTVLRPTLYDYEVIGEFVPSLSKCSVSFSKPQGIAEIEICDENGYHIDAFRAPTDEPIVWYMDIYEGYTITINTDYAEYVAEL